MYIHTYMYIIYMYVVCPITDVSQVCGGLHPLRGLPAAGRESDHLHGDRPGARAK